MTVKMVGPINSGNAAGSAGSATANANSDIVLKGRVIGIYIQYNDAPPAGTTDVTVRTVGTSPSAPLYNFIVRSNSATNGWFFPMVQACDAAAGAISSIYTNPVVYDYVNVLIAGADAGDNADVWLVIEY
jgi:hypothetical protein